MNIHPNPIFLMKRKSCWILTFILLFLSVALDWLCPRRFIMSLSSDSLTTSWWRVRLVSLWPGMEAPASTSKWQRSTKAGLVACVETTMMTDQMISASVTVRQTGRETLIISISVQFRPITSALHVTIIVVADEVQIKGRVQMFQQNNSVFISLQNVLSVREHRLQCPHTPWIQTWSLLRSPMDRLKHNETLL